MKLHVNREALLTACTAAASVVNSRSPKSIVRNLLLGPKTVSGTDLEVSLVYRIQGIRDAEGEPECVPLEVLSILRELDDETVRIESIQGGIRIAAFSGEFELQTQDAKEFPNISTEIKTPSSINAGVLAKLVKRTVFAVANENSRYALGSVAVDIADSVQFVGTDGKRLASMPGEAHIAEKREQLALMAPKSLYVLTRVMIDPEESIEFEMGDDHAIFRSAKVALWTRLVEGRYPRYMDVFPDESEHHVSIPVERFAAILRQAKVLTSDQSRGVNFVFSDGKLTLQSGHDLGKSSVRMDVVFEGNVTVTLDVGYVLDAVKVMEPGEVTMYIHDKGACVLRQGEYEYVVMPLVRGAK